MLSRAGTYYVLIVLLAPIVPAIIVGLILGRQDRLGRRVLLGLNFYLSGALGAYLIVVVASNLLFATYVNYAGIETKVETYELGLTLQGSPTAVEAFLSDMKDFQVSFRLKENPGESVKFSNFLVDGSRAKIRARISSTLLFVGDDYSAAAISPQRTKSVVLGLNKNVQLGNQMEAALIIGSVTEAVGREQGNIQEGPLGRGQ